MIRSSVQLNFPLSQSEAFLPRFKDYQFPYTTTAPQTTFTDWLYSTAAPQDTFQGYEFFSATPQTPQPARQLPIHDLPDSDLENELQLQPTSSPSPPRNEQMDMFPPEKVGDFKHVIYNHLVENYNNASPDVVPFVEPVTINYEGQIRDGFRFNECQNPDKILPELYAQHIRRARLDLEDQNSVFIQDLYKFYLRACLELLGKYFEKIDKYTFLYDDGTPLFIPGAPLKDAEARIKSMRTRARKRGRAMNEDKKAGRRKTSFN